MPDETLTPFARLAGVLDRLGLPTLLIPVSVESPIEQLLVSIDEEAPGGEDSRFVVQMFFAGDVAAAARAEAGVENEDDTAILQFMLSLGLVCPPERQHDLYRLLSVLNRILPVGALELTEEEVVFVRYGLLAENKSQITIPQVAEVLELLGFFVPRMLPSIAALLAGEQSLDQAIEATERRLIEAAQQTPAD